MEPQENKPEFVTQDLKNRKPTQDLKSSILAPVIVLSLIFGALGGVGGVTYALKSGQFQKYLGQNVNQNVTISEDSALIDVVKKASPAVVSIVISQDVSKIPGYGLSPFGNDPFFNFFYNSGQPQSSAPNIQEVGAGSGFFVSSDGLILTNKHVVADTTASYTVLTQDGKKYDAQVLSRDPSNDLAIVKIKIQGAPFLQLGDSGQLQVGQRLIAIGNSLGQYHNTVTSGIVSGIGRKIVAGDTGGGTESLSNVIQTDAAINPGNSGGPLLNLQGRVIGINTAIDEQGQLVGFAIPANSAKKALDSFNQNGKIIRPFLGVRYIIITPDIAREQKLPKDYGALILGQASQPAVVSGSPADKAGLTENDIILAVNGAKVDENNTLSTLLNNYNVGDAVTLHIYHNGSEKDTKVTLGETK